MSETSCISALGFSAPISCLMSARIAVADAAGVPETVGVVRVIVDADHTRAEFAILVRSDWKGRGLGGALIIMATAVRTVHHATSGRPI